MFERARLRLALWYAGAMAVIFLLTGVAAYVILGNQLDDEIDDSLTRSLEDLQAVPPFMIAEGAFPARPRHPMPVDESNRDDRPRDSFGGISSDVFYILATAGGEVLANPRNLELEHFPLARLGGSQAGTTAWAEFDDEDGHYRVVSTAQPIPGQPDGRLIVGRSLEARDYQLRALAIVLGVGGVAGVALAAVGGFWIAGRTLVPIRATLETQRRFVSDASHELRTPVSVMKANAELVLRHPDQTVEANIDQVAAINEEADHMARLVGDLLTLARADEQRVQLEKQRLDLDELLDSLVRDMTALAESKGVQLSARLASGELEGDQQRLRQLGAILLDNALKFTPPRGQVTVKSWRDGRNVAFSVTDTGPGIPPEDQPLIFDRFYRGDKARSSGGTGLGLAIAQWIVTAHGGRIGVESPPGHGATFTVRLPARR
ncbi:MAG: two-component sensor histidine kinase [Anaerolinea sp.]|nr:two-component sensor histidine kinase [Anaerolinea sp.]